MNTYDLIATVKFDNGNSVAKYEIYLDSSDGIHHAEVYHQTHVLSSSGHQVKVWHKINQTIQRLPGNTLEDLKDSCLNHFKGR